MSDHDDTKKTHGFEDHHHVAPAKRTRLDPNYQAPKDLKDAVWDYINGRAPTVQDAPGTVVVPYSYVETVATMAIRELRKLGCTKGFSVAVDPDEPVVKVSWTRAEDLARKTGMRSGYELATDCLKAYVAELDPIDVGRSAARAFLPALEKAIRESN